MVIPLFACSWSMTRPDHDNSHLPTTVPSLHNGMSIECENGGGRVRHAIGGGNGRCDIDCRNSSCFVVIPLFACSWSMTRPDHDNSHLPTTVPSLHNGAPILISV
jgi:hypothetical protein